MIVTTEYQLEELIIENSSYSIWRGYMRDRQPILVKMLAGETFSSEDVAQSKYEYQLLNRLAAIEGLPKAIAFEQINSRPAIIMANNGCLPLSVCLRSDAPNLADILAIAIKVNNILSHLHDEKIIHKSINPDNILFCPETGEVEIIGFNIVTLPKEALAYISPEQTGRMNIEIDYRSDFYSLDITLYHLLTLRLPFETQDRLELLHSHNARTPALPSIIDPSIPTAVSNIVMKL